MPPPHPTPLAARRVAVTTFSKRFLTSATLATTTTVCRCSTFSATWRLSICPNETSLQRTVVIRFIIRRRLRQTRCPRYRRSPRWPFKLVSRYLPALFQYNLIIVNYFVNSGNTTNQKISNHWYCISNRQSLYRNKEQSRIGHETCVKRHTTRIFCMELG